MQQRIGRNEGIEYGITPFHFEYTIIFISQSVRMFVVKRVSFCVDPLMMKRVLEWYKKALYILFCKLQIMETAVRISE